MTWRDIAAIAVATLSIAAIPLIVWLEDRRLTRIVESATTEPPPYRPPCAPPPTDLNTAPPEPPDPIDELMVEIYAHLEDHR